MKVFIITQNDIEGRIDPMPYHPIRMAEINKVKNYNGTIERLGNVSEFCQVIVSENPNQLPYVGLENIESGTGRIINSNGKTTFSAAVYFEEDSILFPKLRPYLNKVFFASFKGIASTEFYVLKAMQHLPKFLYYFLQSETVVKQTTYLMTGNTLPRLQTEDVKNLFVPVPEKTIQEKIIQIMDKAHSRKKQNDEEVENIFPNLEKEILKIIGLNIPDADFEKIFVIKFNELEGRIDPEFYNSEVHSIKKAITDKLGIHRFNEIVYDLYRYPTFYGIEYIETGIPVIKGENINRYGLIEPNQTFDYISEATHAKFPRTQLRKNDLVFTVRGLIGKVGIFENINEYGNINANVIKITLSNSVEPRFYWWYLNSTIGQKLINNMTSGQVQKTITVPDIKNLLIPVLPNALQRKLSEMIMDNIEKYYSLKEEAVRIIKQAQKEVEQILFE